MVESRSGALTVNGFLAKWAVMAAAAPRKTLAHLLYLGYEEDPAALFHIARPRRQERKADQPARAVYQVLAALHVRRWLQGRVQGARTACRQAHFWASSWSVNLAGRSCQHCLLARRSIVLQALTPCGYAVPMVRSICHLSPH